MHVLLVNHRFFPAEGGTERWTLGLAQALHRRGNKVTVLTQSEPGVPGLEILDGIEVRRIPMRRVGGFRIPSGYWHALRSLDYDLLHMSGNRIWCADFYFPVAEVFGGPQVITPHDFYQLAMDPSPLNRLYFGRYLPFRLRAFQAYLALTEGEAGRITRFGYPQDKVRVVGEGIDLKDFSHPSPPLRLRERWGVSRPVLVLYVGGLWPNKRVDRLVSALEPVKDLASLVVVGRDVPGSASDQTHVATQASRLGVEVKFLGALNRAEVVSAYRESDLYALGAQYEGFGISLVEAMASGLPFVSFDVGAARALSREGGGRVARTEEEFRSHLVELVRNEGLCREMGLKARTASRSWEWDAVVDRYLEAYGEAVKST